MRVRFGEWSFDTNARELRRGDDVVRLSPKGFQLLELLIEARPSALAKTRLQEQIWPGTFVTDGSLTTVVKELRSALDDPARAPRLIRTVFGYGYAFAAEVVNDASSPRRHVESAAVLSFVNDTGDPDCDYICDGITEELTNSLARIPHLRVTPRSSALRYRGRHHDIHAVARELRVRSIVSGSVTRRNAGLEVQVDVVDPDGERQMWGGRFQARGVDLHDVQERISLQIASAVFEEIWGSEARAVPSKLTRYPAAYDLFLRGRHHSARRSADGMRRAIDHLRAAIAIDANFAAAHAALAAAYVVLGSRDLRTSDEEVFALARESAERALILDGSIAAASTALAAVSELYDWDWPTAEIHHLRAVETDPSDATARQWYALHLARRGRAEEARSWIDFALDAEPLSTIINANSALVAYLARDYPRAIIEADRTIDLEPHFDGAYVVGGLAHLLQGDEQIALTLLEEAVARSERQPYTVANLGYALAVTGRHAEAQALASPLTSSVDRALVCLGLGDHDGAIEHLGDAASRRSAWLAYAGTEPRLDPLRGHPAFDQIVESIGYDAR